MKKNEVTIGGIYTAKVTNKVVRVRIDAASRFGGWDATNLDTNKKVRIKSPARLRAAVGGEDCPTTATKDKCNKKANAEPAAQPEQTSGATVENATNKPVDDKKGDTPVRTQVPKAPKEKRVSGLDAAAQVLQESDEPMTAKEIVETAEANGIWKSPGGKTPHATIFSAIIREIAKKGPESRFKKTERGKFVANR